MRSRCIRVRNLSPAMRRGINSRNRVWNWVAKLHRLGGRYDNPMPIWFLAPIGGLKLPKLATKFLYTYSFVLYIYIHHRKCIYLFFISPARNIFCEESSFCLNGGNVLLKHEDADSRIWGCEVWLCVCRGFAPERREKDRRTTQHGMFAEICCVIFEDVYQVAVRCRNRIRKENVTRCMSYLIAALTPKATSDPENYSETRTWQVQWRNWPIFILFWRATPFLMSPMMYFERCLDSKPREPL